MEERLIIGESLLLRRFNDLTHIRIDMISNAFDHIKNISNSNSKIHKIWKNVFDRRESSSYGRHVCKGRIEINFNTHTYQA